MSSSSTAKLCFNFNCKEPSEKWRRGWRRRTGEYAQLCDRCASAYEDGNFCETFHMNSSGWRCCESCGKQVHCGCIVSFHMFVLLDAGGIECLTCAKKSYILTPNPAWPPPLHFLPSQQERMKDLSAKSWSAIAGSGPVPWRQAATLSNSSEIQANLQLRTPFEIDRSGSMDRYGVCEKLSTASPESKQERPHERPVNGKWRFGLSETLPNGNMGLGYPFSNNFKPIFPKNEISSSNYNLGSSSTSKIDTDDAPVSAILSQSPPVLIPLSKQVCNLSGIESSVETQIRHGKSRGDGRNRNHLLPRYRPQITDEELQQISSNSKSVITPLFEKILSASDAGRIGRLVLPKRCAEAYFPQIDHPEGITLNVQDVKGKEWLFQFRFWPNNNSRMYVLEGITPCIQSMRLQAGDVVTFSRLEPEGKLVMGGRKAYQVDEVTVVGSDASMPGDGGARNKVGDAISVNGHVKEKILEEKPTVHSKRKNSSFVVKSKRLSIENEDMIELKLTWKEAQGLIRAPAKVVPTSVVVEGFEFEEFEGAEPVIGRPTLRGIDNFGEKTQWVQCEECFKWRKVPEDAILSSRWTCSDNVWDHQRSMCSSAEELTKEQLDQMLPDMNKDSSKKEESSERETGFPVELEGLDALANLAIQGEGEGLFASSENRTKHPRHKPGCTCIVCLQPPSGKGTKHEESCDCVVCCSLKRRFRTLMERRGRKQLDKESESSSHSHEMMSSFGTGNCSLNQEEVRKWGFLEESNGLNSSSSPLKGQIDLNIQPEREEDLSPSPIPGFKQQTTSNSDSILGQAMQQQEGGVNFEL